MEILVLEMFVKWFEVLWRRERVIGNPCASLDLFALAIHEEDRTSEKEKVVARSVRSESEREAER